MHGLTVMYNGDVPRGHNVPEAFDVLHNGDFSGDIKIHLEGWRTQLLHEADSPYARHGNAIIEVEIPFEVIAEVVAECLRDKRVSALEQADWREILRASS